MLKENVANKAQRQVAFIPPLIWPVNICGCMRCILKAYAGRARLLTVSKMLYQKYNTRLSVTGICQPGGPCCIYARGERTMHGLCNDLILRRFSRGTARLKYYLPGSNTRRQRAPAGSLAPRPRHALPDESAAYNEIESRQKSRNVRGSASLRPPFAQAADALECSPRPSTEEPQQ